MSEVIFEVKELARPLCSYPGCAKINGKRRRANWLIRRLGSDRDFEPVCFMCKARLKAMLGAEEQRSSTGEPSAPPEA